MVLKKVAIYLRKSRFDEESETLEQVLSRHERLLLDYCKRNHLLVVKTYKEVVSGENIENRPEVQKLLDDVTEGLYDGVVVIEIERLSRGNPVDQFEILETFKEAKAKIYTLQKVYDFSSDNDIDEEYFEFGLFMSRREYKTIKRRLQRGYKQAQREGYYCGATCPYGYTKIRDKGYILVPDEKAGVIKTIYHKLVYENYGIRTIANYLNENGFYPMRSKEWSTRVLKDILKNRTYIGYIRQGDQWFEGKHEPIIDEKTFELAQIKLSQNEPKKPIKYELVNSLSGLMYCEKCGSIMYKKEKTKKLKNAYRREHYLYCSNSKCKCVCSRLERIEEQLICELSEELKNFNYYLDTNFKNFDKEKEAKRKEISILNGEITKKENMLTRCSELVEEGIYTKEKYIDRVNTLQAEINSLKENIEKIEAVKFEVEKYQDIIPKLEMVLKEYWNLTPKDRNILLKSIVKRIEYNKDTIKKLGKPDNFTLKIYMTI